MRPLFFTREALRALAASPGPALLATLALVLTALAVAVLVPVVADSGAVPPTGTVKVLMGAGALMLALSAVVLVANAVRLSIAARRREVEVMRLVGATHRFIRGPFVIGALALGLVGAGLALLVLVAGAATFIEPSADRFSLLAAPETADFGLLAALAFLACIAVAVLGSAITLRRDLRV